MADEEYDLNDFPDLDLGPTSPLPDLTLLDFEDAVEAITEWFFENFEDPANNTPYEGREGGYQYIWGGPYEAQDELENAFSGIATDALIKAAIQRIEEEGVWEWAPYSNRIKSRKDTEEAAFIRAEELIERVLRESDKGKNVSLSLGFNKSLARIPQNIVELTKLPSLDLSKSSISDLSPLANMKALPHLWFNNTNVTDLTPIEGLSNLKSIDFSATKVSDIAPLANLLGLNKISGHSTFVSDITPLFHLTNLSSLVLSFSLVSNLAPITNLRNLRRLVLAETPIDDLTPLSGLSQMEAIVITGTKIADLAPIAFLPKLEEAAAQDPEKNGLFFSNCPNITDPILIDLSKKKNPERTIETLRYLRDPPAPYIRSEPTISFLGEKAANPPPVPSQSIAPLEIEVREGRLWQREPSPQDYIDQAASDRSHQAYDGIKEYFDSLSGIFVGCNHPSIPKALAAFGKALGENFDTQNPIKLGIHGRRIQALARKAEEELSDIQARDLKEFAALIATYSRSLPDWRKFEENAPPQTLNENDIREAVNAAERLAKQTSEFSENIDKEIGKALDELVEAAKETGLQDAEADYGLFASINNLAIEISSATILYATDVRKKLYDTTVSKSAEGILLAPFWGTMLLSSGAPEFLVLAQHLPDIFGWLAPVIDWLSFLPNGRRK
ncbi:MAG: hypothetical protein OEL53_02615 [Rhodospirillales bacterium]|nr:hypothetical protein [Rhodospirillales bacterium]